MKSIFFSIIFSLVFSSAYSQGLRCSHSGNLISWLDKKMPPSPSDFDIKSYAFDLNIEKESRLIVGNVSLKIKAISDISSVELELHDNFLIDSVVVNNKIEKAKKTTLHHFSFAANFLKNDIFDATIYYRGKSPLTSNDWGNGIVQKADATYGGTVIYSLSVPYMAHEWFPCKQVLTDLVDSVSMKITTDTANTVASNGVLFSDVNLKNGKHSVTWKTKYPINYYLISFVVGNYITYKFDVSLPNKKDKMPVINYLYNVKALQQKKATLDNIEAQLSNYSNLFGLYPFDKEKFGTIIVPLSGGMEHQTLVNLATNYDKYLQAHEMSHQWFGDNVNVKSLHDMWLNEGWASYCEYLTAEKLYPTEAAKYMDNFHNQAYIPNARVFVDDTTSFSTIYDNGRIYAKGAAICHTLRDVIGKDSLFFGAIKGIQTTFKNKSLDIPSFKSYVEKFTGKDLTIFFDQWYYGYGYPRQTITYYNAPSNTLKIRLVQIGSSNLTPIFKTNVEFLLKRTNQKDTLVSVYADQKDMVFSFNNISGVTGIVFDPRNVILNKVVSIKEDASLSANDVKKNEEFVIFPNPAQDYLAIKASVIGNYTVEIFDADASLKLRKEKMTGESLVIDIVDLASGQYILKIYQDKKKILATKQFVIAK